jgi:hypothetical protein
MTMSTHAADTEYLVRKAAGTGYQFASLLIPPVYTTLILARRGRGTLSVNRLLRATWVGGLGGNFHIPLSSANAHCPQVASHVVD